MTQTRMGTNNIKIQALCFIVRQISKCPRSNGSITKRDELTHRRSHSSHCRRTQRYIRYFATGDISEESHFLKTSRGEKQNNSRKYRRRRWHYGDGFINMVQFRAASLQMIMIAIFLIKRTPSLHLAGQWGVHEKTDRSLFKQEANTSLEALQMRIVNQAIFKLDGQHDLIVISTFSVKKNQLFTKKALRIIQNVSNSFDLLIIYTG